VALCGSAGEGAPAVPVRTSAGADGTAEASPCGKASVSGGCGVVIVVVVVVLGASITACAVVGAAVDGQLACPPFRHRQDLAALARARLQRNQPLMIGVRPAPVRQKCAAPASPPVDDATWESSSVRGGDSACGDDALGDGTGADAPPSAAVADAGPDVWCAPALTCPGGVFGPVQPAMRRVLHRRATTLRAWRRVAAAPSRRRRPVLWEGTRRRLRGQGPQPPRLHGVGRGWEASRGF